MRSVLVHTVNRSVSPPVVVNVLYMFIKGGERERERERERRLAVCCEE